MLRGGRLPSSRRTLSTRHSSRQRAHAVGASKNIGTDRRPKRPSRSLFTNSLYSFFFFSVCAQQKSVWKKKKEKKNCVLGVSSLFNHYYPFLLVCQGYKYVRKEDRKKKTVKMSKHFPLCRSVNRPGNNGTTKMLREKKT